MEMNNKYQVNATEENYTIHEPFEKGAREVVNPFNEAAIKGKIRFVRSVLRKTNITDPLIDQQPIDGAVHSTFIDHATSDAAGHVYSDMSLMYIGADQKLFEQFIQNFEMCFEAVNLLDAGKFLQHLYLQNKRLPDVIFIDLPLNEKDLKKFCGRLRYNLILNNLPVVYHENQLSKDEISTLQQLQLVDDIVVIDFEHINYHSKIMFLKQNKLHNQILAVKKYSLKNYLPHRKKQVITFPFFLKRVTDVLVSSTGLLFLSPVFAVIATLIKLESRGPIFYTALRAGKGFKVFKFYKFRSMVANADKEVDNLSHKNQYTNIDGPKFFKISNDPRVTRLGKFLRNTSMDEIPQLLNVLKGDMSLVGNRPLPIYEAVTLTTDEFVERFSAPAGITGLWQVKKRGKANMSTEERIYLDICYSRSYNFVADLKIMVKTPLALFQKSDV